MSGRVVTAAFVAIALGVGVMVGLAAPREHTPDGVTAADDDAQESLMRSFATREAWVTALGQAAAAGRIQGLRVALLIADGTPSGDVDGVATALADGGATIVTTARLGAAWWDPAQATFRGELANQLSPSVVGVESLGATDVLAHAIVQAIVVGALPDGEEPTKPDAAAGEDAPSAVGRQAILLEVLTRAGIVSVENPAADGVDAVVIVARSGPQGAGTAMAAAAAVWERYLGATLVVLTQEDVASPDEALATQAEAREAVADAGAATGPSLVVLSDGRLATAQVVMALVEQVAGGAGIYGTGEKMAVIAVP